VGLPFIFCQATLMQVLRMLTILSMKICSRQEGIWTEGSRSSSSLVSQNRIKGAEI
jgi:hypothetical protein